MFTTRRTIFASLTVLLLATLVMAPGCAGAPPTGPAVELTAVTLPNTDLDAFLYIRQGSPTRIPGMLLGAPNDIMVESVAVYGIARSDDKYAVGGALTFSTAAQAELVNPRIPKQAGLWTQLSGSTIYFLQSLGDPAENLKAALSRHDFKPFNDSKALREVAMMPGGGSTRPFAIGVIKPNKAMFNLLKRVAGANNAGTIDTLSTWGRLDLITVGLYASQQIDVADLMQRVLTNTLGDIDLGMVASVKSGLPGFIVNLAAGRVLDGSGFPKTSLGQLAVYQVPVNALGRTVPAFLNVSGNHVFVTVSPKESYAKTLMTSIKR